MTEEMSAIETEIYDTISQMMLDDDVTYKQIARVLAKQQEAYAKQQVEKFAEKILREAERINEEIQSNRETRYGSIHIETLKKILSQQEHQNQKGESLK